MNRVIVFSGIIAIIAVSVVAILIFNESDSENKTETLTGTPADNYSPNEREKFCGTGEAKSTQYIKEYKIPTHCTQPQAILADPQGNIWVAESNTGNLAKFNPLTESFTEYDNGLWPRNDNSMIWGLDYSSDGFLWFTDDKHNSLWNFEIPTQQYGRLSHPALENSLPQRLQIDDSKIIINDFTGSQIIIFDNLHSTEITSYIIPSNSPGSITSDFAIDSKNNLWYTNWNLGQGGILAKINKTSLDLLIQDDDELLQFELYGLPSALKTPNGIEVDDFDNIWLADSSSSLIFKFNTTSKGFFRYTTSMPSLETIGNYTGKIKSLASEPYWIEKTSSGKIVFNEHGANKIGIIDPVLDSIIEYSIPSQNPNWGDCENHTNCGISRVFDITIDGENIWFSEWAENNIGFVDTTVSLPIDVKLESQEISLNSGESKNLNFIISSDSEDTLETSLIIINPFSGENLVVSSDSNERNYSLNSDSPLTAEISISASETAVSGEYKILLGANTDEVSFSKFLTVIVE